MLVMRPPLLHLKQLFSVAPQRLFSAVERVLSQVADLPGLIQNLLHAPDLSVCNQVEVEGVLIELLEAEVAVLEFAEDLGELDELLVG